jgi:hypothetical protein
MSDTDDRKSRLHTLETALKEGMMLALGLEERTCTDCGEDRPMRPAALYCAACYGRRQAEANRVNQRKRRQRERIKRRLAAGHLQKGPCFIVSVRILCAHCGEPFRPARSSGRYCSARCRVAAHRKAKKPTEPS